MTKRPTPRQKLAAPTANVAFCAAMAESRANWSAHLSSVKSLPASWPIDHRPDGTKPCTNCGGRSWARGNAADATPNYGPGWTCAKCHPPHEAGAEIVTFPDAERIAA